MKNNSSHSLHIGKRAVWGAIYTLIGDYFVYIINFGRSIILARILAPEVFGIMTFAEFFKGIFTQPVNLGFDQAVIRKSGDLAKSYNAHFLLVNLAGLFSVVLLIIFFPFLKASYGTEVAVATAVLVFLILAQTLSATPGVYLRKNFNFKILSTIQVITTIVTFGVSVWLAWQGYGLWSLLSIYIVNGVIGLILAWWFSPWRPSGEVDKSAIKDVLVFGSAIWLGGLFSFLMLQFDDYLVGQFAGLTALGFYSKAYALAQQPLGLFSQVINKVSAPLIAEIQNDNEKLQRGFNLIMAMVFKGTLFVGMVMFIWAPEITVLLIGDKWLPMVPMLRGLILYLIAQPIWDILNSFFTYTDRPKIYVIGQAIQAVALLTLGTLAVYGWGGMGAALIVSSIVAFTTLFYLIRYVGPIIQIDWWGVFILPITSIVVSAYISQWLISRLFTGNQMFFWLAVAILPFILYVTMLFLLQGKQLKKDITFLYHHAFRKIKD